MEKARRHMWASKCFFGALDSRALIRECLSCWGHFLLKRLHERKYSEHTRRTINADSK